MFRTSLVSLLLLASLLSGCTGGSEGACAGTSCVGGEAEPTDDTGAIEGVVVDESIQPLPGALAGIAALAMSDVTSEGGRFVLNGVPPGSHVVSAVAGGYEAGARTLEVVAGKVVEVQFVLVELPDEVPFTETKSFNGLIECGFGTSAVVGNCVPLQFLFDQLGTNPTNTRTVGKYQVSDPAKVEGGVFEMEWTASTAGSSRSLGLYVDADGTGPTSGTNYAQQSGPSPLRIQVDDAPYKDLKPDQKVQTRTFLPGTTQPGYTINQRFTVWGTACYLLECAEDFTVIKDA